MRRPTSPLWRHRDFMKMWTGQTISQFGSSISQLALPIIAITLLHASAFAVAALVLGKAPFDHLRVLRQITVRVDVDAAVDKVHLQGVLLRLPPIYSTAQAFRPPMTP